MTLHRIVYRYIACYAILCDVIVASCKWTSIGMLHAMWYCNWNIHWDIVSYYIASSTGLNCTTYDIIMAYHLWSFIGMLFHTIWYCNWNMNLHIIYNKNIYVYIHCLKAYCFFYCMASSCDVIIFASHWWSFNRIRWHVTWYCTFNICWGVVLCYIFILLDYYSIT